MDCVLETPPLIILLASSVCLNLEFNFKQVVTTEVNVAYAHKLYVGHAVYSKT